MPQVFNAEVDTLEGRDAGATAFLAPPPRRPGLVVGTGSRAGGFYRILCSGHFWTFGVETKMLLITKASCQAWLKLLFANEVRIGGPGAVASKRTILRHFPN